MRKIVAGTLLLFLGSPALAAEPTLKAPDGFHLERFSVPAGLDKFAPVSADAAVFAGNGKTARVVRLNLADGGLQTIAENIPREILSVSEAGGETIISFPGRISKIGPGKIVDLVQGLPIGDYLNTPVDGKQDKLYFGQGTVTNSGVVGPDNAWLGHAPSLHDLPCRQADLSGLNVTTDNFLTAKKQDTATTGSYMSFNAPASRGNSAGFLKCSGAVYNMSPDGSALGVYAWGFHVPQVTVADSGQVWVLDRAMEERGSRPIPGGQDSIWRVEKNGWYGWPDYQAGVRVPGPWVFAADPAAVAKPFLSLPKGKYLSFLVSPDNFLRNRGVAVSGGGLELVNLENGDITPLLSLPEGMKITDAKFGPGGFYFLVSQGGGGASLFRLNPDVRGAVSGSTRKGTVTWPWAINGLLLGIGVTVYFLLKRPPRMA
ncbi:MAG: hypothetical protein ACM3NH_03790 [Candidatus Saccharibacteria bacterium]